MEQIWKWIDIHLIEIAAALGLTGGGGVTGGLIGKRLKDRQQDAKIKSLFEKHELIEKEMEGIRSEQRENKLMDENFRKQQTGHNDQVLKKLDKMEDRQQEMMNHLITLSGKK